ncbi:MAG: pseudouridine-5'-phosphate glycosidase [Actinomycetota bacterium]|nr:pseudouridine-5'-phosphate glycosidase [Actinomycetota bacterium]
MFDVRVSDEVATALAEGRAVVAMESTIFSHLGLPSPANEEALSRCEQAVRAVGAVPAVTAVFNGVAHVGISETDRERVCGPAQKMAERDIPVATARGWKYGATTVSAALALAERAGIRVFATGGIGGVHRGSELTGDISADLDAIARRAVVTVSAGAKAFLDLARTLEYLETAGAPVVGWQTNEFPAFYTRTSGLNVPHRVETAEVVAAIFHNRTRADQGVLLAVPRPELDSLDAGRLDAALASALEECEAQEIRGAAITPFLLERITVATDGDSLPANLALAEHNAEVAAQVAVAIAQLG